VAADAGDPGPARSLRLTLANDGTKAVTYNADPSTTTRARTRTLTVEAKGSAKRQVARRPADGYYDVTITANTRRRLHPPLCGPDRLAPAPTSPRGAGPAGAVGPLALIRKMSMHMR